MPAPLDCLIVGGGPAGLTAAIYAARFYLKVLVINAGGGRAALIPRTHNHAGFPDGISGLDLLGRMRDQAMKYDAAIRQGVVLGLGRDDGLFVARTTEGETRARAVLLATGVSNGRPDMSEELHVEALRLGRLRYCPVCDGYEVTDQNVVVIGNGPNAAREAEFLRAYTRRVTLIATEADDDGLDDALRGRLDALGVRRLPGPVGGYRLERDGIGLECGAGRLVFDTLYPALGSTSHSDLARAVGAELGKEGCIKVDSQQRTGVPGLYAAGDVVLGLDQISNAMGQAGVATTTIRNDLARERPLLR